MQSGGKREREIGLCLRQLQGHPVRRNELVTVGIDLHEQIMLPYRHADRQPI